MNKNGYDVFISYRRSDGSGLAQIVRQGLEQRGYNVFLDVADLPAGAFDKSLVDAIERTPDFVPILTPDAVSTDGRGDDWFLKEVSTALAAKRNVCPLLSQSVNLSRDQRLPHPLDQLALHHGITYVHEHCDAVLTRLSELLSRKPRKRLRGIQLLFGVGGWRTTFTLGFTLLSLLMCVGYLGWGIQHGFMTPALYGEGPPPAYVAAHSGSTQKGMAGFDSGVSSVERPPSERQHSAARVQPGTSAEMSSSMWAWSFVGLACFALFASATIGALLATDRWLRRRKRHAAEQQFSDMRK